jgi:hypothetical protein
MTNEITYWYCPDCGIKGYARGGSGTYETLRWIGVEHRQRSPKCLGMHIRVSEDENQWPESLHITR